MFVLGDGLMKPANLNIHLESWPLNFIDGAKFTAWRLASQCQSHPESRNYK
jgi:hypothetical protein